MNNKLLFAKKRPLSVLCILEGLGLSSIEEANVLALAKMPNLAGLMADYPSFALRNRSQDINQALQALMASELAVPVDFSWLKGDALAEELRLMKKRGGRWHTLVWLRNNDQQTIDELKEVLTLIERKKIDQAYLTFIVEAGFDWSRLAELDYQPYLSAIIDWEYGANKTLDWAKTKLAQEALVKGLGESLQNLTPASYAASGPIAVSVDNYGEPKACLAAGDLLLWLGGEPAVMRQLADSLAGEYFQAFARPALAKELFNVSRLDFGKDIAIKNLAPVKEPAPWLPGWQTEYRLGIYWDASRLSLLDRLAGPKDFLQVASKLETESVMEAVKGLYKQECDFIIVHSSELLRWQELREPAKIEKEALELDNLLKLLSEWVLSRDGRLFITSPFGWAENMFDARTETWRKQPSDNPVPLVVVDKELSGLALGGAALVESSSVVQGGSEDVLPTIAAIETWPENDEWQGKNLLKYHD